MRKRVFIVEDHFQISGRGLIIVGKKEDLSFGLKVGTALFIIKPNGEEIHTEVSGLEMFSPPNFKTEAILIRNFTKQDLPIGSSVFVEIVEPNSG